PEHLHDFWPVAPSPQQGSAAELAAIGRNEHLSRYEVNVLVDNSDSHGAPVVLERNPTLANLLGRIEFRAVLGAMVTDFRQIRAGSIHRANGGYLILHVVDLLRNPFAWETLKRALISKEITIESPLEQATVTVAGRLRPEPIPASLKVLLIGPRSVYQALYQLEEDFAELFAVRADFAPDMHWTGEHVRDYAAFIARQVRDQHLLHLDAAAVATVIEFSATQREHQQKLSARMLDIANLVAEASYWAGKAGHDPVMAMDVDTAIRKRMYRSNLIEERLQEMIDERTLAIATAGTVIGQVNGLSVIDLGDYSFGRPSRISARVSPGKAGVQSIERDIELSGPIHSKGVMILAGYLRGQYGAAAPLALSATLTFEQTYDMIDGDSASSTELYALLSALSGTPIDQGIAVTGAVDQFGRVQAVGGVTRKIEGFFAVCNARGLTGSQGVVVPSANVQHLMLDQDVVEAIRNEMFHVWAVETVDQGMALLTGLEAGERDGNGAFPDGSIHALVAARLDQYLAAADSVSAREEDRKSSTKRKTR
ncbi:MAG: Lon protease family protein, partial [Thermomicrobiales bacterium]